MPNTIKTSADKIVEKYRPYVEWCHAGNYDTSFDKQLQDDSATRCAIIDVQEKIELLLDHFNAIRHVDSINKEYEYLHLIEAELKSRIV